MASSKEIIYVIYKILKRKTIPCACNKLAKGAEQHLPRDVPPGHLAVIVGKAGKRFIIKADYLNQPVIRQLLEQAYEDCSPNKDGPLAIPCDEFHFQHIINSLQGTAEALPCYMGGNQVGMSFQKDSEPLLARSIVSLHCTRATTAA